MRRCVTSAVLARLGTLPGPARGLRPVGITASAAPGRLSPDGPRLPRAINRPSRDNELRIVKLDRGAPAGILFGTLPVFSKDSQWVAIRKQSGA